MDKSQSDTIESYTIAEQFDICGVKWLGKVEKTLANLDAMVDHIIMMEVGTWDITIEPSRCGCPNCYTEKIDYDMPGSDGLP